MAVLVYIPIPSNRAPKIPFDHILGSIFGFCLLFFIYFWGLFVVCERQDLPLVPLAGLELAT